MVAQKKRYEVQVYYSSFCSHVVDAENKIEALQKAREQKVNENEIVSNLEAWPEADIVKEIAKKDL